MASQHTGNHSLWITNEKYICVYIYIVIYINVYNYMYLHVCMYLCIYFTTVTLRPGLQTLQ